MKPAYLIVVSCLLLACGGSGGGDTGAVNRDTLTQRQRDSILARSRIPGASGVGRAMIAADSASARAARADSLAAEPEPR